MDIHAIARNCPAASKAAISISPLSNVVLQTCMLLSKVIYAARCLFCLGDSPVMQTFS